MPSDRPDDTSKASRFLVDGVHSYGGLTLEIDGEMWRDHHGRLKAFQVVRLRPTSGRGTELVAHIDEVEELRAMASMFIDAANWLQRMKLENPELWLPSDFDAGDFDPDPNL